MARQIYFPRKRGLHKKLGGFWRGERCEVIVQERIEQQARERAARRGTTRQRSSSPGSSELRRLQRALGRRKTLAARQRIQRRIDALRAQD